MRALGLVTIALAACSSFENPEVVLDFRVLAMSAEPPEQVIDVDIQDPAPPIDLLDQVVPTEVCVLLSDRDFDRRLRWEMTVCTFDSDLRCTGGAMYTIGSGLWDDPELSPSTTRFCDSIQPDGNLLGVALYSYENDQLRGLGGIYYGLQLRIGGENDDPEQDLYAAKSLRLMPRIPAEITANTNPSIERVDVTLPYGEPMPLAFGRCADQVAPLEVPAGTRVRLTPVEPEGVRETYVVPTIDGSSRMFTESPTYQWLASQGNYSSGSTGGTRDAFGNPAPLFTDWRAPAANDIEGTTDIELWFIQRDERLGVHWYESCIRAVP